MFRSSDSQLKRTTTALFSALQCRHIIYTVIVWKHAAEITAICYCFSTAVMKNVCMEAGLVNRVTEFTSVGTFFLLLFFLNSKHSAETLSCTVESCFSKSAKNKIASLFKAASCLGLFCRKSRSYSKGTICPSS